MRECEEKVLSSLSFVVVLEQLQLYWRFGLVYVYVCEYCYRLLIKKEYRYR